LKETLLSAMGNLEPQRLLDPRYLDLDASEEAEAARMPSPMAPALLPILED
jgi:hypothetical protein